MNSVDYFSKLGLYYGEPELHAFLKDLNIAKPPKIPKDDTETIVSSKTSGVDLTFTDESYLDFPTKPYPDGAMVLSSINFHGTKTRDHAIFSSALPKQLEFSMSSKEVQGLLGPAQDVDEDGEMFRWDFGDHCMFIDFDAKDHISSVGIQLHNRYTKALP